MDLDNLYAKLKMYRDELVKAKQEAGEKPIRKRYIRDQRKKKPGDKLHDREQEVATSSEVGEGEESKWRKPKSGESHHKLNLKDTRQIKSFAGKQAVPRKPGKAFVGTSGRTQQGLDAQEKKWQSDQNKASKPKPDGKPKLRLVKALLDAINEMQEELAKANINAKNVDKIPDNGDIEDKHKMRDSKHMNGTNVEQYNHAADKVITDRVPEKVANLKKGGLGEEQRKEMSGPPVMASPGDVNKDDKKFDYDKDGKLDEHERHHKEMEETVKYDANGQWSIEKSNYGPKGMGQYSQKDNIRRKYKNTGEEYSDIGQNKNAKRYTTSGSSMQRAHEAAEEKRQREKTKASTKIYTEEEKRALEAKMNKEDSNGNMAGGSENDKNTRL